MPVLDAGEAAGLPYYTMPWVEGESLRARLDRHTSIPLEEAISVVGDIAKALSYAHAHGVVHRDIKPENVLLSGHTAVVTDFGIAKALSASRTSAGLETLTQIGTALGTPSYMAPEQAMGDPATDHRADLYALGIVAFELLAGERPFSATSMQALIRAHVTEAPPSLAQRRPGIPPALAALVMRCLAKEPADRPQSADDVLQALTQLRGARESDPRGSSRWHRYAMGGAAAALIAAAIWWRARPEALPLDATHVLVALPATTDPTLSAFARSSADATARALGQLAFLHLASPSSNLPTPASASDADAVRAARAANAGTIVVSTADRQGRDSARVVFRVLDAVSGQLVRSVRPVTVPLNASDSAWVLALDPVLSVAAVSAFPWLGAEAVPLGEPPRFASVREMLTALTLGARGDSASRAGLLLHLQRAASLDSTFAQPKLWYAASFAMVHDPGYSPGTDSLLEWTIRTVDPARGRLNPFEEALLGNVVATRQGDQAAKLASLRRMQTIVPNAPLARDLPLALLNLDRPREALALTLHEGITRDENGVLLAAARNPAHWARLAEIHHYLGEYRKETNAADQLRQLQPDDLGSVRHQLRAAAALGTL